MTTWKHIEDALLRHQHEPDLLAARALYAAVAAHRLTGPPARPSSNLLFVLLHLIAVTGSFSCNRSCC